MLLLLTGAQRWLLCCFASRVSRVVLVVATQAFDHHRWLLLSSWRNSLLFCYPTMITWILVSLHCSCFGYSYLVDFAF